ncbi:hypothetical protein LTR28_004929 [Elasticomyces elasticus]|nr:hypothetical protein LTR28_004929 [Elasticomyces elasticus]
MFEEDGDFKLKQSTIWKAYKEFFSPSPPHTTPTDFFKQIQHSFPRAATERILDASNGSHRRLCMPLMAVKAHLEIWHHHMKRVHAPSATAADRFRQMIADSGQHQPNVLDTVMIWNAMTSIATCRLLPRGVVKLVGMPIQERPGGTIALRAAPVLG